MMARTQEEGKLSSRHGRTARHFVKPTALAGDHRESPAASLLAILIGGIFLAEIDTPNVVVAALYLLPIVAAMWLLSNWGAALVAGLVSVFFGASLVFESANRFTLIVIGLAILVTGALVRVHASAVAALISSGPRITGLTRRELEVANLASQAYTAAEIGSRLHIGERTVETHLSNTYTKLRITSRRELIRIATRLGPP